jgi:hypothetical protein
MQGDGNLVLYAPGMSVRWHSYTDGNPGAYAEMQGDGNFVIYNKAGTNALWSTQTDGKGAAFAQLQTDGNFVLYTSSLTPVWDTKTRYYPDRKNCGTLAHGEGLQSPNGSYTATFQYDGNFVLHGPKGLLWQSDTANQGVNRLAIQADGNLVLYVVDGNWAWQSYTPGNGAVFLQVQNDGNMVLYTTANRPIWSSETDGGNPSPSVQPPSVPPPVSSVGGPISRNETLQRAQFWVDRQVPYSQTKKYPDPQGRLYRTDCSGYVSMAWHLAAEPDTLNLPNYSTQLSSWDQLLPGDILLKTTGTRHVVLFARWTDSSRTSLVCYEQDGTRAAIKTRTVASMKSLAYVPRRYVKVTD